MTGALKENIAAYRSLPVRLPKLLEKQQTKEMAILLDKQFGSGVQPPQSDLEETYRRFIQALDSGGWDIITDKDWRYAAFVMWYGTRFIANENAFRTRYLQTLRHSNRASRWKSLIRIYLVHFEQSATFPKTYQELAKWVQEGLQHSGCHIWRERHELYHLFNSDLKVSSVIDLFMDESRNDWHRFTSKLGLTGELATSGYLRVVALELLGHLKRHVIDKPSISYPILDFFSDKDSVDLRFKSLQSTLIESLLMPWANQTPAKNHQNYWQNWLLKRFGDPRFLAQRERNWAGADKSAQAVMRRWLVGATIKQFFDIIDQLALEHQWRYRRAFWEAYYDAEHIEDAWVILGKKARVHAIQTFGKETPFGNLENAQDQTQAVLLLKLRECIIAEWSHNGACRAWNIGSEHCPDLLSASYKAEGLRKNGIFKLIHNGDWQPKLAEHIWKHTGIRMEERAYRI